MGSPDQAARPGSEKRRGPGPCLDTRLRNSAKRRWRTHREGPVGSGTTGRHPRCRPKDGRKGSACSRLHSHAPPGTPTFTQPLPSLPSHRPPRHRHNPRIMVLCSETVRGSDAIPLTPGLGTPPGLAGSTLGCVPPAGQASVWLSPVHTVNVAVLRCSTTEPSAIRTRGRSSKALWCIDLPSCLLTSLLPGGLRVGSTVCARSGSARTQAGAPPLATPPRSQPGLCSHGSCAWLSRVVDGWPSALALRLRCIHP